MNVGTTSQRCEGDMRRRHVTWQDLRPEEEEFTQENKNVRTSICYRLTSDMILRREGTEDASSHRDSTSTQPRLHRVNLRECRFDYWASKIQEVLHGIDEIIWKRIVLQKHIRIVVNSIDQPNIPSDKLRRLRSCGQFNSIYPISEWDTLFPKKWSEVQTCGVMFRPDGERLCFIGIKVFVTKARMRNKEKFIILDFSPPKMMRLISVLHDLFFYFIN